MLFLSVVACVSVEYFKKMPILFGNKAQGAGCIAVPGLLF